VTLVDVLAQRVGLFELLVTHGTSVVVQGNMLGHTGSALELCIAVGACVRHYINKLDSYIQECY